MWVVFQIYHIRLFQIIEFDNRNLICNVNGSCPLTLHLPNFIFISFLRQGG